MCKEACAISEARRLRFCDNQSKLFVSSVVYFE